MRITYAKSKSDATAKLEGTYDPATRDPEVRAKRKAESQRAEREARAKKEEAGEGAGPGTAIPTDPTAPPNEILFVQGLPGTPRASRISRLVADDRVRRRVSHGFEFATSATRALVFSSSDSTLHIPIKLSERRVTTKHLRIEDDPRRVLCSSRTRVSDFFASTRPRAADVSRPLVSIPYPSRRGDDGADVVDALPAVPRVQGGAHGGGETRDRVRGVRDGDAGERRALGAAGVQDQPHAQHDAVLRQKVTRRRALRFARLSRRREEKQTERRGIGAGIPRAARACHLVLGHCTRRGGAGRGSLWVFNSTRSLENANDATRKTSIAIGFERATTRGNTYTIAPRRHPHGSSGARQTVTMTVCGLGSICSNR